MKGEGGKRGLRIPNEDAGGGENPKTGKSLSQASLHVIDEQDAPYEPSALSRKALSRQDISRDAERKARYE